MKFVAAATPQKILVYCKSKNVFNQTSDERFLLSFSQLAKVSFLAAHVKLFHLTDMTDSFVEAERFLLSEDTSVAGISSPRESGAQI